MYAFGRHGQSGTTSRSSCPTPPRWWTNWLSHAVYTDAINHDPAITMIQTGDQRPGKPSLGAWLLWATGRKIKPSCLCCIEFHLTASVMRRPFIPRLLGSRIPALRHQGCVCGGKDPVLYLSNPQGVNRATRAHAGGTQGHESASI